MLKSRVTNSAFLIKGKAQNSARETVMLNFIGVKISFAGPKLIKDVKWIFPPPAWTKVNIDRAARGNPGNAEYGGVFRMCRRFVNGSFVVPLGVQSALYTEMMGLVLKVESATFKNGFPLSIELDFSALVGKMTSFSNDVP